MFEVIGQDDLSRLCQLSRYATPQEHEGWAFMCEGTRRYAMLRTLGYIDSCENRLNSRLTAARINTENAACKED